MKYNKDHQLRVNRVAEWYGPARFGLFYHWGMFTGGGDSGASERNSPLHYQSIEQMEADAGDPVAVAKNWIALAKKVGAKYVIFTVFHTCGCFAVMYPTRVNAFVHRATRDYVGAFIEEAHREGIKAILYLPPANPIHHIHSKGGPWLLEGYRDRIGFARLLKELVKELHEQHGEKLSGFWLDGMMPETKDLPQYIHSLSPRLIVIINNEVLHDVPETDMGTTEFLSCEPDPNYNRPSGLIKANPRFEHILPPKTDFNEDIPTCNGWWHQSSQAALEGVRNSLYVQDPTFWVKEMLASLGQRRKWNYVLGVGPLIDGTLPPLFTPMWDNMARFMGWASESIYGTQGGEGSGFLPGWWNNGSFGSVTVSLTDPCLHYLHVTTAPSVDFLRVPHNGVEILAVTDLRTGTSLPFHGLGSLDIPNMDWSDVAEYGAKVLKVRCA